ncbi:hypothetical protein EDB81DRAFT_321617 [Dactylonectria macrodidyma]|uniref:Adhesin domain-containing protein n=1 Tax=Dactylonectria macrodidyma TaxID=307937 RepID=A0A9P9FGG7_9HYPO|nr:hypothetical protein EDB81DRAFT_321617 [Dactylonectria macrodidyma]
MPSPYSDNLYSAADPSDDEADALSPTDGYFHASSDLASSSSHPQSPFHRSAGSVPRVPNVFVEDPTLLDPGSKAREAEAERTLLNSGSTDAVDSTVSPSTGSAGYQPSRFAASPPNHHHRRSVEEHHNPYAGLDQQITSPYMGQQPPSVSTALFSHHRDAPPAYTPSPTSPPSTSYQTFAPSNSTMGLPEEQQRLIPRGPESMGGPTSSQEPSRWQRIKSSITGIDLRKKLKTALGVLVIFSVVAIILGSATMPPKHRDHGIDDDQPVKKPDMEHSDLVWNPTRGCLNGNLKHHKSATSLDMHYNNNLTIIQKVKDDDNHVSGWSPHVTGEIILRPTDDGSPGTLELEIIANDENIKTEFDKDEQTFKIITPRKVPWSSESEGPCIQIRATVWAPRKAILNSLKIDTVHLDVEIREGLILGSLEPAIIRTVVGDVQTPAPKNDKTRDGEDVVPYTLASREIHISTTSGDVVGWYPLYDVLDIRSASGDISTEVGTKPADPQAVRPAVLRVHSISGQIAIQEPLDSAVSAARPDRKFPPRDYIADISTASGDITADIAFSSRAIFESQSGDFKLRLWPVLDSGLLKRGTSQKPVLKTDTKSGETKVKLLEPLWTSLADVGDAVPGEIPGGKEPYIIPAPNHGNQGPGDDFIVADDPKHNRGSDDEFGIADTPSFSCLTSSHTSISGGLKLEYPSSWEGKLTATTISGKQKVRGEGLHVDNNSSGPWSRRLRGTKGTGNSQLTIDSVSGSEDVLIGVDVESKTE